MIPDPHRLLLDVVGLAREAGRAILGVYAQAFAVQEKADSSPLTEADLAAERILAAGLRRLAPEVPILSEESESVPWSTRASWDWLWVVDPLDGTREFVKRNGEFCINVALVADGAVCLGLLLHPPSGTIWYAGDGIGAWRLDDAGKAPLRVTRPCPDVPRVAASRSHGNPAVEAYYAALGPVDRCAQGSALKFARLAEGGLDVYARLASRCSEWDVAAGQCIVEQAGGEVIDEHGVPLRYNQRDTLIVHNFLAYGDHARPWLKALDGIALHD